MVVVLSPAPGSGGKLALTVERRVPSCGRPALVDLRTLACQGVAYLTPRIGKFDRPIVRAFARGDANRLLNLPVSICSRVASTRAGTIVAKSPLTCCAMCALAKNSPAPSASRLPTSVTSP
jgi:hypothetical protein